MPRSLAPSTSTKQPVSSTFSNHVILRSSYSISEPLISTISQNNDGDKLTNNNTLATTLQNVKIDIKNKVTQTHTHTHVDTQRIYIRVYIHIITSCSKHLTPTQSRSRIPRQIKTLKMISHFQSPQGRLNKFRDLKSNFMERLFSLVGIYELKNYNVNSTILRGRSRGSIIYTDLMK